MKHFNAEDATFPLSMLPRASCDCDRERAPPLLAIITAHCIASATSSMCESATMQPTVLGKRKAAVKCRELIEGVAGKAKVPKHVPPNPLTTSTAGTQHVINYCLANVCVRHNMRGGSKTLERRLGPSGCHHHQTLLRRAKTFM
jgi:hypothetical protein